MKKAKIIIPSIALLCFSAIACVTGSVAWFTSVTTASVATSNFKVQSLDGEMNTTVSEGVGTKVTKEDDKTTVVPDQYGEEGSKKNNVLTHGSVDCGNQKVYTLKPFSSADAPEYEQIGKNKALTKANESSFYASGTEGYYHVFTFDIKFVYDFKDATSGLYNLYFDVTSTFSNGGAVKDKDTAKGFRIGFYNTESKDWVVWSNLQYAYYDYNTSTKTGTKPSRYIGESGSPAKISEQSYTTDATGNLIYQGDTSVSKITSASGTSTRKDCIGQFNAASATEGKSTITIRVAAWFEGDDPNVSKGADMSTMQSSISFYVKGDNTPAA